MDRHPARSALRLTASRPPTVWRKTLCFAFGVLLAFLVFAPAGGARAQTTFANITSYRVNGAPNYSDPGSEPFWASIPWTDAALAASVAPGGGHTANVLVKSANDGFNAYVLFRWNDSAGPAYVSEPELYRAPNGTLQPLPPNPGGNITQLFYNSTYYYPDRVAVLWFLENASQRAQSPAMQLGTNGAITQGAGEIWHWQADPTDNNPQDAGFPGGYTDPAGNPIYPPDNLSFAESDYTNTTGFFVVPGSIGGAPNLDPYADPFQVHVGNVFNSTTKQWTVEMVRTFTTSGAAAAYQVQLRTGLSYYVAFAVWNGRLGESAEFKSISAWYNLTISATPGATPAPTPAGAAGGVDPGLAAVVAAGTLIVGLAIGLVLRWKPEGAATPPQALAPTPGREETDESGRGGGDEPPPGQRPGGGQGPGG